MRRRAAVWLLLLGGCRDTDAVAGRMGHLTAMSSISTRMEKRARANARDIEDTAIATTLAVLRTLAVRASDAKHECSQAEADVADPSTLDGWSRRLYVRCADRLPAICSPGRDGLKGTPDDLCDNVSAVRRPSH